MSIIFKDKLNGERISLVRTKPFLIMAQVMFRTIDSERVHLKPWFPWVDLTQKVEDSLIYLINKEIETNNGTKVEYGIYLGEQFMGNISMFDINLDKKSGEIGYWISSKFIRKGYTTEAVKIIESEFFNNLGLNRIQIKCAEINVASSRVAERCDYKFEGLIREERFIKHLDKFVNSKIYSKLKSEWVNENQ